MNPTVSILMTAYNREDFLAEAVESVVNNTYADFELIICDDGSTDKTVAIARDYASKDARIRVLQNPQNLGDYANRNHVARQARGKYLLFVDSDDKLYANSLPSLLEVMNSDDGIDMIMSCEDTSYCDRKYEAGTLINIHFYKQQVLVSGPGGTFMRNHFFKSIGGYPEEYGPANDAYFNLKAAALGKIFLYGKQISFYRIHAGQEINNKAAYLLYNYTYQIDALNDLPLGLSEHEKNWLIKKAKRRFFVNVLKYFKNNGKPYFLVQTVRKAKFGFKDALQAIFH